MGGALSYNAEMYPAGPYTALDSRLAKGPGVDRKFKLRFYKFLS